MGYILCLITLYFNFVFAHTSMTFLNCLFASLITCGLCDYLVDCLLNDFTAMHGM